MIALLQTWSLTRKIKLSFVIAKIPLCLLVAFSALFGHILAQQKVDLSSLQIFFAILLLSCGGASYNSYQERFTDKLMTRTQSRPLVKNMLSSRHAVVQSTLMITAGLAAVLIFGNIEAFIAGLCGIVLYNLAYTRLKPKSVYALIPGAICGAMPPYIGWLAANGEPLSYTAALLISLLIFWQIPHFFLVMLNHRSDYLRSLAPNMLKLLNQQALHRVFMPWITALSATMITFITMEVTVGLAARIIIIINAAVLFLFFFHQLFWVPAAHYKGLFRLLNGCLFIFMTTLCMNFIDLL